MEHNLIAVLLRARAEDNRRTGNRLGAGARLRFVLISLAILIGGFAGLALTLHGNR